MKNGEETKANGLEVKLKVFSERPRRTGART